MGSTRSLAESLVKALAMVSLLVVGAGCHRSFGGAKSGYDQQACLERALRRNPSSALVADGAKQFGDSCRDGELESCSALGVMHELGLGVPRDMFRALALYRRACDGGNAHACINVGTALAKIEGEGRDTVTAAAIFKDACEKGNQEACTRLAGLYLVGDGVSLQPITASRLLNGACDRGNPTACLELGKAAQDRKDTKMADTLFEKACFGGDIEACARLGAPETAKPVDPSMVPARTDVGLAMKP